jgi:hypothetical protein
MDGIAGRHRARWTAPLLVIAAVSGCGKRGDPLPPLPVTPQAVTSLKLAQRGDHLEISYVAPRSTTGGVRLGVLDVEILRADMPSDPGKPPETMKIAEFQKAARRERHRAAPGESLADTSPLPPPGTVVRVAARALDGSRASNLSSVATLVVEPPPPAPADLSAELKGDAVALRWTGTVPSPPPPAPSPSPSASPSPTAAMASPRPSPPVSGLLAPRPSPSPSASPKPPARGFLIYRRRDPSDGYAAPVRSEPFTTNAFEDRAVSLGQRWCYVVGTVVSTEPVIESRRSNEACVSVRDIVPPATPTGVAALGGADGVEVSWTPSTEADLASYRVYRQAGDGGARERLGEVVPPETALRDTTAAPAARYVYTVTAVDTAGNESTPSAPAPGGRP